MNLSLIELLLGAGFGIAAIALGMLGTIGLLVWLAGCPTGAPRATVASDPASAVLSERDREFSVRADQRTVGRDVPPGAHTFPRG